MTPKKKFIIFGMIGCLCFSIGDWMLGYVNPAPVESDIFFFIRMGHGVGYDTSKAAVALVLATAGMCFLYPGVIHISDIAKDEKTKHSLGYAFGLCSVGWLVIHFLIAINVIIFSQAEKDSGHELAATLSHSLGGAGIAALFCAYLFVAVSFIKLVIDILRQRTYLKKSSVLFTPIVPMGIIFVIAQILPLSPFSYGLYTFCMNGGMLVWFMYLLVVNQKGVICYAA